MQSCDFAFTSLRAAPQRMVPVPGRGRATRLVLTAKVTERYRSAQRMTVPLDCSPVFLESKNLKMQQ